MLWSEDFYSVTSPALPSPEHHVALSTLVILRTLPRCDQCRRITTTLALCRSGPQWNPGVSVFCLQQCKDTAKDRREPEGTVAVHPGRKSFRSLKRDWVLA